MMIVDGHTDIPRHLYLEKINGNGDTFMREHYMPLKESQVNIAVVNIFTKGKTENSLFEAMVQIEQIIRAVDLLDDVILIKTKADLKKTIDCHLLGLILSLEGMEPLERDPDLLNVFYALGVRAGMLTWNGANRFASGFETTASLSESGKSLVKKMHSLGILVDVSHLNDEGFWNVLTLQKKTIIASHSNVRQLFNHPRNLTDEQIIAIAKSGGVIGTTPYFTKVDLKHPHKKRDSDDPEETIEDYIQHIEYIVKLVGYEHVAFGFDFNWYLGDFGVEGIENTHKIKNVVTRLLEKGHLLEDISKIAGQNLLRVFNEVLK
ncbi:MAG: membrane dipeptidase [Tissierellales bacterium]|nr:membrane dipeptidase [Tissierellales bacterium]